MNFLHDFRSNCRHFSLVLDILTPYFYKTLDSIWSILYSMLNYRTKYLVKYPSHTPIPTPITPPSYPTLPQYIGV